MNDRQLAVLEAAFRFLEHGGHDYASRRLVEHPQATRDEVMDFLERRWQVRPGYRALDNFLRKYGLDRGSLGDSGSPTPADGEPSFVEEASPTDLRVVTPSPGDLISPPPLFTSDDQPPYQEILDFRQRQHQEQAYRIGVYDQFLDVVPCGYDKRSPNPKRPRFPRGPLQMLGWLVALVLNAIMDLADQLPACFHQAHVRTIRRKFFNLPGDIYLTPEAVIVWLDELGEQEALRPVLDRFNTAEHRVPWLDDRLLVLSLPPPAARAGP
ncbi:MAG: hypothetical protein ACE5E5_15150 [Phycisphaerae bacterium]